MLNFFNFSSTYNSYPRQEYNENLLRHYDNLNAYFDLLNQSNSRIEVRSNRPITLSDTIHLNDHKSKVEKILGNPTHSYCNRKLPNNLKVYLYKHKIGGFKTKTELHFFNDHLFYFNHYFADLSTKDKLFVLKTINKKYFNEVENPREFTAFDDQDNKIYISEDINLTINYLSNNQAIIEELVTLINEKTDNQKIQQLREEELYLKL